MWNVEVKHTNGAKVTFCAKDTETLRWTLEKALMLFSEPESETLSSCVEDFEEYVKRLALNGLPLEEDADPTELTLKQVESHQKRLEHYLSILKKPEVMKGFAFVIEVDGIHWGILSSDSMKLTHGNVTIECDDWSA